MKTDTFTSKALIANLKETAVKEFPIPEEHWVLLEVVSGYQGLEAQAVSLIKEINHPYRNLRLVIADLRSFILKNFRVIAKKEKGPQALEVAASILLDIIQKEKTDEIIKQAAEALLAILDKMAISLSSPDISRFWQVFELVFSSLKRLPSHKLLHFLRSYFSFKKLAKKLLTKEISPAEKELLADFLSYTLKVTYEYWLSELDPAKWIEDECFCALGPRSKDYFVLVEPISHESLRKYLKTLEELKEKKDLEALLLLPDYLDILRFYKDLPDKVKALSHGTDTEDPFHNIKILVLFKIVETPGTEPIHEDALQQINRELVQMIRREPSETLDDFIIRAFALLKKNIRRYPWTALQCIRNMGFEILDRGDPRLAELFLEEVVKFGFQPPEIKGVDKEWHLICNPAHILNIRTWLDIISHHPKWCTTLLSALIINLQLAGTCIRDTDLFQKDVSKLLNSEIEPVYNLVKQFCRILPVYYNEIGAEGLLRDVSTELDEIHSRKDELIHFLRKQSHVESSNLIIDFIEAIFNFWLTKDKKPLKPFIPFELYERLPTTGPYIDPVHEILVAFWQKANISKFQDLLPLKEEEIEQILAGINAPEKEKRRVFLLIKMYQLEVQKYGFDLYELKSYLEQSKAWGFEGVDKLLEALEKGSRNEKLEALLDYLEYLQGIILSPQKFNPREDIYFKRHIAANIPSMYGRYHEKKFDALGLTFRLEALANVLFEELVAEIDIPFITRSTFFKILKILTYFRRALQIEGISSKKFNTYLDLLQASLVVRRFTYTQYLDIFRGLLEGVKDIAKVYYISPHRENLAIILRQLGRKNLLPKYLAGHENLSDEEFFHRVSERFIRDLIAQAFGLQALDNFVGRLYRTLLEQREKLSQEDLDLLMTYDPGRAICPIYKPNPLTQDLIHLGNKGHNLYLLATLGMKVPPGFIITTEAFRCYRVIKRYQATYEDFLSQIRQALNQVESLTGKRFGDPENPLLISVRSGAAISMPGMMATVLNVGSNIEIIEGLARKTGNLWFAWDTYRRFLQSWAMAHGVERETFNRLMREHKNIYKVKKKREFSGEQMRELALKYREVVKEKGVPLVDDPWEQLLISIDLVFSSWNSEKARAYRQLMGISDYWGTAAIVQAMTFGNLSLEAGTGVVFTAPPFGKLSRVALWGDYTPGNQGEDIVSGLVTTYPISIEQKKREGRADEPSLEEKFPEIYKSLYNIAQDLIYNKKWSHQEIEFTFEGPEPEKLFILQSRDMVTKEERPRIKVFVRTPALEKSFIGRGIGVSGGALSGRVVFTLEDINELRKESPVTPLVLLRFDTVPDDIKEISAADGLLTARGGQTSHAAIVASRLGKTCVVGYENMSIYEEKRYARLDGHIVKKGDWLSIDGVTGHVYLGRHEVREAAGFPEVSSVF
ncbi:PEP/pyruvate-binding domain-containing protein [Thermodesulfatator atlanticus]|uniref:PEP/pyruvate-binding domain-containing protein n=1 Tax=Thermodesulfatator atlanticus TaxID=501497 RepID=UPI0003B59279|nr:PEP/pyruvate-binding domain-containing protein [Thermodesulfatator atlanticus]